MPRKETKDKDRRVPLEKRLTTRWYRSEECDLAIQGQQIPQALGDPVTKACVVRGIRAHMGFGEELRGESPEFTRALNARQIMSNIIPEMTHAEEFPYCIWYPTLASEDTYRQLAQRYSQTRYNVGRACAVAGYTKLFCELDLLPDVHIAEEARDNGSHDIYEIITAHRDLFSIMNDYDRTINTESAARSSSRLNGDTAVCSILGIKRQHQRPHTDPLLQDWWMKDMEECKYFNITEDFCVDTSNYAPPSYIASQDLAVNYLYTPLPSDLPPLQKDLLILSAAYYGDVDRYWRLRRPAFLVQERSCIIRGIYHNSLFAQSWAIYMRNKEVEAYEWRIMKALTARAIMNNDLSDVTAATPSNAIPYCIWHPSIPGRKTLEELVARRPDMKEQVARVCIVGNDQELYDLLDPAPTPGLFAEAQASRNPSFKEHLEQKAGTGVGKLEYAVGEVSDYNGWQLLTRSDAFEPTSNTLVKHLVPAHIVTAFPGVYNGQQADISKVSFNASFAVSQDARSDGLPSKVREALEEFSFADIVFGHNNEVGIDSQD